MTRKRHHPLIRVLHWLVASLIIAALTMSALVMPLIPADSPELVDSLRRHMSAGLLVLVLTLPLFMMAAFVGFVDGLVRRDVRKFGAGRESGFIYHRAKASLMPLAILPWVIYLALPISVHPLMILLPSAVLLGLATNLTAGSFKKYL